MSPTPPDSFDLERFVAAQRSDYATALGELRAGRKRSHWIWYIFPQVAGLGSSGMSRRYAIKTRREAAAYLAHPVLGPRLAECTQALLALAGRSAREVMGSPDDLKLCSSMTLFAAVAPAGSPYAAVLERYFGGAGDVRTLEYLAAHEGE